MTAQSAQQFIAALRELAQPSAVSAVSRFFHANPNGRSHDNEVLGVSIGSIFPLAKQFSDMPLADIEVLLDSPYRPMLRSAVEKLSPELRVRFL